MHSQCAGWQKGLEYLQSDQNMGSHTGLGTNYLLELRHPRVKNDVGMDRKYEENKCLVDQG